MLTVADLGRYPQANPIAILKAKGPSSKIVQVPGALWRKIKGTPAGERLEI